MALLEPARLAAEDNRMGLFRGLGSRHEGTAPELDVPEPDVPEPGLKDFRRAVATGDWASASHLWAAHRPAVLLTDPIESGGLVAAIPEAALDEFPVLQVAAATTAAAAGDLGEWRTDTLRAHTEACRRAITQHGDQLGPVELAYIGSGHLAGLRQSGQPDAAEEFGAVLVERLIGGGEEPALSGSSLGWVYLQWGVTATLQGEVTAATARYEQAWKYGRAPGITPHVAANAAANLALVHAIQGNTIQAEEWLVRYQDLEVTGPWRYLIGVGARVAAGLLALDRRDAAAATDAVASFGVGVATVELWPFVAYMTVCHSLAFGHPADAVAALDDAVRSHSPLPPGGFSGILLASARAHALTGVEICEGAEAELDRAVLDLSLSRLHFLTGQYDHPTSFGPASGPPRRRGRAKLAALAAVTKTRRRPSFPLCSGEALALVERSQAVHALLSEPDCDPGGVRKLENDSLTAEALGRQSPPDR